MKIWSNRFKDKMSVELEKYTSSIKFDNFLLKYDIKCSICHVLNLKTINIINKREFVILKNYIFLLKKYKFIFKSSYEDIHLNFENELINLNYIGNKIRSARSRNDLVSTDLKLWFLQKFRKIYYLMIYFLSNLLKVSEKKSLIFTGFTHFQIAQPINYSHYLLCYFEMFLRDVNKLLVLIKNNNFSPLGACALFGTNFFLNNFKTGKILGFDSSFNNSIDAVSDRDYVNDSMYFMSSTMIHFSRFSEDIVNYSNNCINILELSDSICTGSSIMPQKKNPDILEVVRSKCCVVIGNFFSILSIFTSQTLSYNKDIQEDKKILKNCYKIFKNTILVFNKIINNLHIKSDRCEKLLEENFSTATDMAEYLTKKGVPYKISHSIISLIVRNFIKKKRKLNSFKFKDLKEIDLNLYNYLYKKKISLKYISVKNSLKMKYLGYYYGTMNKEIFKNKKKLLGLFNI
ncbi:argininosuccinate lyase [Candidatus Vidania fulgoroideorum]